MPLGRPGRLVLLMSLRSSMHHGMSSLTRHARRGFTLPEILIVIVMISVLALVAIPRFANANGKRHMESARMRIAAALATARQAAIQKGAQVRFQIDTNLVTVRRVAAGDSNLVSPVPLTTLYKVSASGFTPPLQIDFSSRAGFDGMWTDGTSVCHDALLSCCASRWSVLMPRSPTPNSRTSVPGTTRT